MRTNIVLDQQLLKDAFKVAPAPIHTKRELITLALEEFIENHKKKDLRILHGKVKLNKKYDYKILREVR